MFLGGVTVFLRTLYLQRFHCLDPSCQQVLSRSHTYLILFYLFLPYYAPATLVWVFCCGWFDFCLFCHSLGIPNFFPIQGFCPLVEILWLQILHGCLLLSNYLLLTCQLQKETFPGPSPRTPHSNSLGQPLLACISFIVMMPL